MREEERGPRPSHFSPSTSCPTHSYTYPHLPSLAISHLDPIFLPLPANFSRLFVMNEMDDVRSAAESTAEAGVTDDARCADTNGKGFHVSRRMVQSVRVSNDAGMPLC